ncbi:MAG: GAF domain-containing protein, partial [Hymenobacter sp.]
MARTSSLLLPPDEAERLHTLRAYDILHSVQEPLFDELVELAAHIFNVPISLLALVDADEVEYKAVLGLSGLRKQPRGEALCSLAVRQGKTVIITDLSSDKPEHLLAPAQAAAQAKGVKFYAGAPLRMPNQRCIGTLCLIDQQPRTFSPSEQQVL